MILIDHLFFCAKKEKASRLHKKCACVKRSSALQFRMQIHRICVIWSTPPGQGGGTSSYLGGFNGQSMLNLGFVMVKSHLIWQLDLTRVKSFHQCRLEMVTDIKDDMAVHAIEAVNSNPFKRKTL
jgi:hypothetical protein